MEVAVEAMAAAVAVADMVVVVVAVATAAVDTGATDTKIPLPDPPAHQTLALIQTSSLPHPSPKKIQEPKSAVLNPRSAHFENEEFICKPPSHILRAHARQKILWPCIQNGRLPGGPASIYAMFCYTMPKVSEAASSQSLRTRREAMS